MMLVNLPAQSATSTISAAPKPKLAPSTTKKPVSQQLPRRMCSERVWIMENGY
jgi:hypothetical protein